MSTGEWLSSVTLPLGTKKADICFKLYELLIDFKAPLMQRRQQQQKQQQQQQQQSLRKQK